MAIQHRRGNYTDYKPSKMLPGELAVTLENDPKALDGKALRVAFAPGIDKTLMTVEDAEMQIEDAAEQAAEEAATAAVATATSTATAAATTATDQATLSKSYAVGGTNSRSGENTDNSKYYKEQAASSASSASSSSSSASSSASFASSSASTATTQATKAQSYAVGGTGSRTGENTDNAKYYKEQAEAAAASLDTAKILGDFASYESTTTASKAYKVGELLTYNGYLYRVTTAISSGDTITPGTNVVQTNVGEEVANRVLVFDNISLSAASTSTTIGTMSDSRITANHVIAYYTIASPSNITSDLNVTTSDGSLTISGTCSAATSMSITLIKKDN